jgi:hypothetical protein
MKGTVRFLGKVRFQARADSGHSLTIDGPAEVGARIRAPVRWSSCSWDLQDVWPLMY